MDFLKSMAVAVFRILTSPEASAGTKLLVLAVFVSPILFALFLVWMIARARAVSNRWRELARRNGWRSGWNRWGLRTRKRRSWSFTV